MKKIFIIAVVALLGLSMTSCKCTRTQDVKGEEVVVDSTLVVEAPADSVLVAE